ncbi:MAG TPA: rhodanese-like domain-containing protein [Allosphingosinicella sp.]
MTGEEVAEAVAAVPRVSPKEAKRLIAEEGALLIDVREAAELERTGKLAGALHLPLGQILAGGSAFPIDRPLVLYCAAGIRSALAGKGLLDGGHARAFNLGGFEEVARAGWKVEAPA